MVALAWRQWVGDAAYDLDACREDFQRSIGMDVAIPLSVSGGESCREIVIGRPGDREVTVYATIAQIE